MLATTSASQSPNDMGKQSKLWSQLYNNSKQLDSAAQSRAGSALTLGGPMGVGDASRAASGHQILGENNAPHGLLRNELE